MDKTDVTQKRKHCHSIGLMALFAAEDRVGHVTEMSSSLVIIDNTPPVIAYLAAGTVTQEIFMPGDELTSYWMGMEDRESGVDSIQVASLFIPLFWSFVCSSIFSFPSPAMCAPTTPIKVEMFVA